MAALSLTRLSHLQPAAAAALIALSLLIAVGSSAHAQTFTVLYNFTGEADGGRPGSGITSDKIGSFYGTTQYGGDLGCDAGGVPGCGVLFKFNKTSKSGGILTPLFQFHDGPFPTWPGVPALGPDDELYGTTLEGGVAENGALYSARPDNTAVVPFPQQFTPIYQFTGGDDGGSPVASLVFDNAGNIYGTTAYGGAVNFGVVYELQHSGNTWNQSTLYTFTGSPHAARPRGIVFDDQGNIYGAAGGGNPGCDRKSCGTIYQLTPSPSGFTETILYTFREGIDGGGPGPLIRDNAGNLYGLTYSYGPASGGTVWELSPSNGTWTFTLLYAFPNAVVWDYGPFPLTLDPAGNLFGIINAGGANNEGMLFELAPGKNGWTFSDLHDFGSEGCTPEGAVVLDSKDNIYGVTEACGKFGAGTLWEFIP